MNKNNTETDTSDKGERAWAERLRVLEEEPLKFKTLSPEEIAELKRQGRI